MCPGNRAIFTCQQTGTVTQWNIDLTDLQQGLLLQLTAQSSQVGSVVTSPDDLGYNFELHILSNSAKHSHLRAAGNCSERARWSPSGM